MTTKVEPTVEKWERDNQLEDFLQAVCDGLIERLGVEPDGHKTWAVTTDQIIAEVREEIPEHFYALLNNSVQEAKKEKSKSPEIEITSSSSFEDMLKLPDGQVVIVDVAKIKKAVQEAKAERDREILQWLQDEGEISQYDKERLLASLKQEEEVC